jgi:hypothetical protein
MKDSQCPDHDSNQATLKYKLESVLLEPTHHGETPISTDDQCAMPDVRTTTLAYSDVLTVWYQRPEEVF